MLAADGYVVLAIDMYGGRKLARDMDEAMAMLGALRSDPAKLRARVRAGLEALRAAPDVDQERVAAIGFCFGGLTVLELARDGADIAGVVSFHGLLETARPARAGEVKGRVLVCHGINDPLVPPAQLVAFMDEFEKAGVDWQVSAFAGAAHGFMNRDNQRGSSPGIEYHERTEKRAWSAMQQFLQETLGAPAFRAAPYMR